MKPWRTLPLASLVFASALQANVGNGTIIDQAIADVFRPSASALATSTTELSDSLLTGCEEPDVRQAFVATVEDLSRLEYYRLGAMNQKNRAERLFFWPDRKGIGQRQLQQLLADPERSELDGESLALKSVALQGLPALERILFADAPIADKDCAVARAIADNMATIAAEISTDWADGGRSSRTLQSYSEAALYRSSSEVIAALLTLVEAGLYAVREQKVMPLVEGLDQSGEIVRTAPLWRSEQTLANIRGNLDGLKRLLVDAGLAGPAQLGDDLAFEMRTAGTMLDAAEEALASGDVKTARDRLDALDAITLSLSEVLLGSVAPALGVQTGFNSGDGD